MSLDATRWAWQQGDIRPADKLVLLSLADRAGEAHSAHPSIARLAADTNLDRKTVMTALERLAQRGLIRAEKAFGRGTRYQLIGVENRHSTSTENGTGSRGKSAVKTSTENGTSPKNGTGPESGTSPVPKTGPHQSQKRDTESTKNLPRTYTHSLAREGLPDDLVPIDWQPGDIEFARLRMAGAPLNPSQDAIQRFIAHYRGKQQHVSTPNQITEWFVKWMIGEKTNATNRRTDANARRRGTVGRVFDNMQADIEREAATRQRPALDQRDDDRWFWAPVDEQSG